MLGYVNHHGGSVRHPCIIGDVASAHVGVAEHLPRFLPQLLVATAYYIELLAVDDAAIGRPRFAIVDGIGKGDFVGHVCLDYAVTYSANR